MYFVVEYNGERKMVKAKATATCTDIGHLAFGFHEAGDVRTREMRAVVASRRLDVAHGAMCNVWPPNAAKDDSKEKVRA